MLVSFGGAGRCARFVRDSGPLDARWREGGGRWREARRRQWKGRRRPDLAWPCLVRSGLLGHVRRAGTNCSCDSRRRKPTSFWQQQAGWRKGRQSCWSVAKVTGQSAVVYSATRPCFRLQRTSRAVLPYYKALPGLAWRVLASRRIHNHTHECGVSAPPFVTDLFLDVISQSNLSYGVHIPIVDLCVFRLLSFPWLSSTFLLNCDAPSEGRSPKTLPELCLARAGTDTRHIRRAERLGPRQTETELLIERCVS